MPQAATPLRPRPFDPFRSPASDVLEDIVKAIASKIEQYEREHGKRKRRRKPDDQQAFEETVSALVCDVVHRSLTTTGSSIAVPMSKQRLNGDYAKQSPVFNQQLPKIVHALASPELALLELHLGYHTPFGGIRSSVRAAPALAALCAEKCIDLDDFHRCGPRVQAAVALRAAKRPGARRGRSLPLPAEALVLVEQMEAINAWIAEADLDFDDPFRSVYEPLVDTRHRHLQRIFTDGTLASGGRLYNGFWMQLSKEARRGIRIEGQRVVERDYGQVAVRIAYSAAGVQPPSGDLYVIAPYENHREGIKHVLNALLSKPTMPVRFPQGTKSEFPPGTQFERVCDAIAAFHRPISHLFGKGLSGRIQRVESDVLIHALAALRDEGVVALPVHDCLIVPETAVAVTDAAMKASFKAITGLDGVVG